MIKPNPLLDVVFLQKLYSYRHKEIYAKIIALDNEENAMEQIEGQVTGGSVSLDGSSNVRRSCSLTMVAQNININSYYWGIKNKFKLFIGLNNTIDSTYEDIIWFPFGVMVITNFSTALSTNGYNISISGKDKMCLLNGDLSGSLFASVDFGKEEYYDTATKITTITDIPIKNIIRDAVHDYAQEPWENIIINDLEDLGLELLDYKGSSPLYLIIAENENGNVKLGDVIQITMNGGLSLPVVGGGTEEIGNAENVIYNPRTKLDFSDAPIGDYTKFQWNEGTIVSVAKVENGQTCGYRYTDITYAGDLILSVGEPVTAMLDKLVAMLGNWEYFYDVDGRFIFQRKKTYLDKTWNNIVTNNDDSYIPTAGETYVESALWSSAVSWNFTDSFLVTTFNNTPVLNNVRNDYSIWGTKKSVTGVELPVHLRYAIDKKPTYYKTFDGRVFMTQSELLKQNQVAVYRTQNINGLNNDWWKVTEWAKYYAACQALNEGFTISEVNQMDIETLKQWYPTEQLGHYYQSSLSTAPTAAEIEATTGLQRANNISATTKIPMLIVGAYASDLNNITAIPGQFSSHGSNCVHDYTWFIDLVEHGYEAYVYSPEILHSEWLDPTIIDNINVIDTSAVIVCDWRELIFQMAKDYRKYARYTPYDENDGKEHQYTNAELLNFAENFKIYLRNNNGKNVLGEWRYPSGDTGYEQYYIDLEGFWRQLYCPPQLFEEWYRTGVWTDRVDANDVVTLTAPDKTEISYFISTNWVNNGDASKDGWNTLIINAPSNLNFWFDFLDPDKESDFAKYSVPAIGDRAKSVNDNMVKAIYFREVPNTIFTDDVATVQRKSGYTYMQYDANLAKLFVVSTQGKCAIDVMEEWINNHIYAVESTNITTIPIYHLQPNTRIKITDKDSNINGDYIVSRISIPLTYNGTMSITATKVADRVY